MRVTITRRIEQLDAFTRFLTRYPRTIYYVCLTIEFTHEELAIIEERQLGKYVMFTYPSFFRGAVTECQFDVDCFVKYSPGMPKNFDFRDLGDADEFERTARAAVSDLKKYISATGAAGYGSQTFEL